MGHMIQRAICFYAIGALLLGCPAMDLSAIFASVKAMGMGGTAIADPQDALSAAWNPANSVLVGNRLDVGFTWLQTDGRSEIVGNAFGLDGVYQSSRDRNSIHPDFGVNVRVCGSCDFTVGLIAYNKGYIQTDYESPILLVGTTRPGLELYQVAVSPIAAVRFDAHSIGVALQLAGQRFKVRGFELFDNSLLSVDPGDVTNRNTSYSYGIGCVVGYSVLIGPGIRFGLAYEPRTWMGDVEKYEGFLEHHGRLHWPERYSAGMGLDFLPCLPELHINMDFQFIRWSSVSALGNHQPVTLDEFETNPLASGHGPGFGWKDQPFVRFGMSYDIPERGLTLRTGYRWCKSPLSRHATWFNLATLDTIENLFTAGFTWGVASNAELSGFYAYGCRHRIPDNQGIDPDLGGGFLNLTNSYNTAGLAFGVRF